MVFMKLVSKSVTETDVFAISLAHKIKAEAENSPKETATIVALYGDLGAGKTTFTKSFAQAWGIEENVASPTFVIQRIYPLSNTVFQHFIHIDAYRLETGKELMHLGWKEIAEDSKNIIVIEWPEKVADILPDDMIKLQLTFIDETVREIVAPEKYAEKHDSQNQS